LNQLGLILLFAELESGRLLPLGSTDLIIIVLYFVLVLALGLYLKQFANTTDELFMAGREMTAWVTGLSFISANLDSLEMMGYAAATAQYGILVAHAYWIAAIPAIMFLSLVMLPFYYICKTHSVPGYLHLRYGEGASWCALLGVVVSIGTAYLVMNLSSIIVYAQMLFGFFVVPMFGTVILGMLWKRTTPAAGFWGLLAGIVTAVVLWLWVKMEPSALRFVAFPQNAKDMAENVYRSMWTLIANLSVTVAVTLFRKPKAEKDLEGLVYGLSIRSMGDYLYLRGRSYGHQPWACHFSS
jgi:Na+/proline symporter